jgi:DNA-binding CsgD family transcriptional regulator
MSARRAVAGQPTGARDNPFRMPEGKPDRPLELCRRCRSAFSDSETGSPGPVAGLHARATVLAFDGRKSEGPPSERLRSRFGLTPMETAVARGLLDGLSYKEIAEEFAIATETVHSHVKAIHRKADVATTGQFVALFLSGR